MPNSDLIEAINLIKSNKKPEALTILSTLVRIEPKNELAWLWLSVCIDDSDKKKYCLQKVLDINPTNEHAIKALKQINYPQPPTTEEIIQHPIPVKVSPKRNKIFTCLLSCVVVFVITIIIGINV